MIAPPVVIRSKDWVTNKHIKIPILPDNCSPAAFRVWLIKLEKYLEFIEVWHVWNIKYEDRPQIIDGVTTQYIQDQWAECNTLIGHLLSTAMGDNTICDSYIA